MELGRFLWYTFPLLWTKQIGPVCEILKDGGRGITALPVVLNREGWEHTGVGVMNLILILQGAARREEQREAQWMTQSPKMREAHDVQLEASEEGWDSRNYGKNKASAMRVGESKERWYLQPLERYFKFCYLENSVLGQARQDGSVGMS